MENARTELCGACSKGSHPVRKSFNESIICACGAPFFSQIVSENNLPIDRRCLIEIPMEFMEDHGSRFDKTVTLQEKEDSVIHRVKIGGNLFLGFGFEWRDFAQMHNIGIQQLVVFTLVARSRFLVQIYKVGYPYLQENDDVEVCVAQDSLVAKASSIKTVNPLILPSEVKAKKAFLKTSSGQAIRALDVDITERLGKSHSHRPSESKNYICWTGITWLYE